MQRNVAGIERLASLILGGLSLSQTLSSKRSTALRTAAGSMGLALLWRGASGSCPIYSSLDISTATKGQSLMGPDLLERSSLVNLPIDEVRSFLEMEETPYGLFDSGIIDDQYQINIDDRTWTLSLSPHADHERTLIKASWVQNPSPSLETQDEPIDPGTLGRSPKSARMLELRKLKSLMETGEIATIEGQSHGERSPIGKLVEKFGDFLLEKVQSKTALSSPNDLHPIREDAARLSYPFESNPKRKAHA